MTATAFLRQGAISGGAVAEIHHHPAGRTRPYRRLPMPWAVLAITHGALSEVAGLDGVWRPYPRLALQGLSDVWTDVRDPPSCRGHTLALIEPWATEAMFGIAAGELAGRVADVERVSPWGREQLAETVDLEDDPECLLEAVARRLGALPTPQPDAQIVAFAKALFTGAGTGSVWREVGAGLSERTLRSRFRRAYGVSPKQWARLGRFSANLRRLHAAAWTPDVQDPPGYFDQSHEIREFRRMAGVTPGGYRAAKTGGEASVYAIELTGSTGAPAPA
ncbi:MAG TPA: helix-turn-helix domain-containing protein [Caulobacter sp.]|nr:helix-turn-helix domain-containing protein [Caulobacter sp.]